MGHQDGLDFRVAVERVTQGVQVDDFSKWETQRDDFGAVDCGDIGESVPEHSDRGIDHFVAW